MIEIGIKGRQDAVVQENMLSTNVGSGCVKVFATPMMIALIEKTATLSVEPFLEEGQSTVGTLVNVAHLAATPVGMKVYAETELIAIDRRKLTFKVSAYDEKGLIGEGTHERFIIDIAKFQSKADEKSQKCNIKAIVFDMGGVLIDLFYDRCVAAYKALGFNDICDYLDPCHQKGIYGDMESGKASEDEFYDFFLSKCHEGTTRQDIDACMKSFYEGPSEKTGELLKSLKQKGYGIYMLSNNNPIMMRICDSDFKKVGIGISDFFDQAFISSSMKMMKPDAAIFNEAIRRIGLNANELLFIDDSQVNVSAAQRAGMNAILYTPGEDLKQVIEKALR